MSIELYPSIAKIKRNGVYENLPGFVPETGSVATQQMIATAESSATAQYVHNKSEYFRLNDTLYQAIAKINVGDTIVVGTNCEVAVIGNDLSKIASSIANYELGIATSSHNTGDYFMVNETMYVAKADIQVGDTISTSTNCRLAVVGDELSGLKTALTGIIGDIEFTAIPFTDAGSGYVNYQTGAIASEQTTHYTDYVDLANYKAIKYKRMGSTSTGTISAGIAFYDQNKNYISGIPTAKNQASAGYLATQLETPIPDSAKFARFTLYADSATYGSFELYGISNFKAENDEIINAVTSVAESRPSTNLFDGVIDKNAYLRNTDDYVAISTANSYTINYIPVEEGDVIVLGYRDGIAENIFRVSAYNSNKELLPNSGMGAQATSYTVPSGVSYIRVTANTTILENAKARINNGGVVLPYEKYGTTYSEKLTEEVHSYNWVDPDIISAHSGKFVNGSGILNTDAGCSYTGYIPVEQGDVVYALQDGKRSGNGRMYRVAPYDESLNVVSGEGQDITTYKYDVPSGVKYVIVSIFLEDYATGTFSINVGKMMPYDEYGVEELPKGVGENRTNILLLDKFPLETMPEYVAKAISYRPLTAPKKGYFCFVTDDGHADMVTYTIPMVIDKQIPCTFAVFKNSACFATPEQTAVVVDAVQNHGCVIAQHGGINWTEYSEYGLNKFFDDEKVFWDSLGVEVKSAVYPSHYMSYPIMALVGGRFGVVRSGGLGYDADGNYGGMVRNWYDYFTSGAGSNLFGLSSYNVTTKSLATNQAAVDYAYANNTILICYIHENSLTTENKAILEGTIDYAKTKGLEFITLDQIPYLNEGTITM